MMERSLSLSAASLLLAACNLVSGVDGYHLTGGTGGTGGSGTGGAPDPHGRRVWSRAFGDGQDQSGDAIAADPGGNVIVSGFLSGDVKLDSSEVSLPGGVYATKLDPGGSVQWAVGFPTGAFRQSGFLTGLAVDAAGSTYLSSPYAGSVVFGATTLTAPGGGAVFVTKLDTNGSPVAAASFGNNLPDAFASTVAANGGTLFVAFDTNGGSVDLMGTTVMLDPTFHSIIALSLDKDLGVVWGKHFATSGAFIYAQASAVDASGNAYLAGKIDSGTVDFGCGPIVLPAGSFAWYVVKLDPTGKCVWSRTGGHDAGAHAVAVDAAGAVYLTGGFAVPMNVDGHMIGHPGSAMYDTYVMKLDPAGSLVWGTSFGGDRDQAGDAIAVDAAGHVFITGDFGGTADFGKGPLVGHDDSDVFVLQLDSKGATVWSRVIEDPIQKVPGNPPPEPHLALDPSGAPLLTGGFTGQLSFDDGTTHASLGGRDIWVAKLAP